MKATARVVQYTNCG